MKEILERIRIHFILLDTVSSIIAFFFLRGIVQKYFHFALEVVFQNNASVLYPIFLSSGLTLLGFLLTGVSIVIVFLQSDKLDRLRDTDHPKTIMKVYFSAIRYCSTFTAISFLGVVTSGIALLPLLLALSLLLSMVRLARCIWVIEKIAFLVYR